jgi:D-glycero-D-manno-heptose 1,7-bisphosphate phosphatase
MANSENRKLERVQTVFLDRDGVLNKKMPEGRYVTSWEEFELLPGVAQAIRDLNRAGIRVIVVSNQRGIALGYMSEAGVEGIHTRFQEFLKTSGAHVDAFYFCPHDKGACECRKPKPGLFQQAMKDFPEITPDSSVVIGDSLSDIEAGRNLGMATVLVAGDAAERRQEWEKANELAGASFASFAEAVRSLIA